MFDAEACCLDVLRQSHAVEQALKALERALLDAPARMHPDLLLVVGEGPAALGSQVRAIQMCR